MADAWAARLIRGEGGTLRWLSPSSPAAKHAPDAAPIIQISVYGEYAVEKNQNTPLQQVMFLHLIGRSALCHRPIT